MNPLRRIQVSYEQNSRNVDLKLISLAIISIACGFPLFLLQMILSPVILIKCTRISAHRIGHMILEVDWYLSSSESRPRTKSLFFFATSKPVNSEFRSIATSLMSFVPRFFGYGTYFWNRAFRLTKFIDQIPNESDDFLLFDSNTNGFIPSGSFLKRGEELKCLMGIEKDQKIACFYIRDGSYARKEFGHIDQSFADYRDSTLENYVESMLYLAERNYFVIRMGKYSDKVLETNHPNVLDYCNSGFQSDFADIFLSYAAEFAISTDTGMTHLPLFFRKPLGLVNVAGFHGLLHSRLVKYVIPKTYLNMRSGSELTLQNIFESGLASIKSSAELEAANIRLIECTSEEILGLTADVLSTINSTDSALKTHIPLDAFSLQISQYRNKPYYSELSSVWKRNHPTFLAV